MTAEWAAKTDVSATDTGLAREEALRLAPEFLRRLREGHLTAEDAKLSDAAIDVLHAACEIIQRPDAYQLANPVGDAEHLYRFIESAEFPDPDFAERIDLKAGCAFAGWRVARRIATPSDTSDWHTRFIKAVGQSLPMRAHVEHTRTTMGASPAKVQSFPSEASNPERQRLASDSDFDSLNDPETLLQLLETFRERLETDPRGVLREATFLYTLLSGSNAGAFLLDEREFFLGETARIVGTVCRHLSRRDEVRLWLNLSENWFLMTANSAGNLSKVDYQRLALRTEERDFSEVLNLLPQLTDRFAQQGMSEDSLKSRFLEAEVLKETGRLNDALAVYAKIVEYAKSANNHQLLALARVNLVQIYGILGRVEDAANEATQAVSLLRQLGNRIALAKLHWGVGYLQRSRGDVSGAITSYRTAQNEFIDLSMRADVAAVHLLIADLLLDNGQDKQAEWEIRQALPIIDEYKLVPEGFAAMTLLRESLRRQQIDRQALRNLHGYFEELGS